MKHWAWILVGLSGISALAACSDDESSSKGGGGTGGTGATGGTGGTGATGATGATGGTGGNTGGTAGSGGNTGGSAGAGLDGGPPVSISGTVNQFQQSIPDGGGPIPIAGAQVCVKDSTLCATTDANGEYSIPAVPSGIESALLITKTGYANTAIVGVVAATDMTINAVVPTAGIAQVFALAAGFTWPLAGKSYVLAQALETVTVDGGSLLDPVAGATISITPNTGVIGPVYVTDLNFPDPTLTSSSGQGWGGFGDVVAGEYTLKVALPGRTCVRNNLGWPATNPDEARVPAIPDYILQIIPFTCDP